MTILPTKFLDARNDIFSEFLVRSNFSFCGGNSNMRFINSKTAGTFRTRLFKFIFLDNNEKFN